jgi:hypothetical protein
VGNWNARTDTNRRAILILGDLLAIMALTLIGFASHNEIGTAPITSMLATFIPLAIGWSLFAPWLGLFDLETSIDPRQLWRPAYAAILVSPFAGWLRAEMLNGTVIPLFVLVLGGNLAVAMLTWRALWWVFNRQR